MARFATLIAEPPLRLRPVLAPNTSGNLLQPAFVPSIQAQSGFCLWPSLQVNFVVRL
ncbi:hypothetical protein MA16_Dca008802 [Dendrobium catenatum]|uniref:Uncharacterized protein n=1 Tax=Dendrobium catenatum TaxID=906689 RepID=A0A2I0VY45_9ASPA|nr:hypothetical protein MA16_Dca008802 [Dendrobium catenatum]